MFGDGIDAGFVNGVCLCYSGKKPLNEIMRISMGRGETFVPVFRRVFGGRRLLDDLGWRNKLFYGDNFDVLSYLLLNGFKGKVRLVYIDPPFGTGSVFRAGVGGDSREERTSTVSPGLGDVVAYEDTLTGAGYLEFLRERLVLLRELLSDDGSIYVHIDTKHSHYVKLLLDEVFGEDNFVNDISRIKCNPKNFSRKAYGNIKDVILFYSKTDQYVWNDPREEFSEEDIERLYPKTDANGRRYTTVPLHAPGETRNGVTGGVWRGLLPPKGRHWRYSPHKLDELDAEGRIEWSATGNPRLKMYADEVVNRGKKVQDVWEFKDPVYPSYPTEKNPALLDLIIRASSNPGDLVLDAFAGSGTTLIVSEGLGRRWVGIDNSAVAIRKIIERFKGVRNRVVFEVLSNSVDGESIVLG